MSSEYKSEKCYGRQAHCLSPIVQIPNSSTGKMRFFKNGSNGGSKTFARNGEKREGGFILEGYKTFKVSILKSTIFYEDLPYVTYPLFSKFCPSYLPHTSLSPAIFTDRSVVLFLWLNGWQCKMWCVILLNDNMDLHISRLGSLASEGP